MSINNVAPPWSAHALMRARMITTDDRDQTNSMSPLNWMGVKAMQDNFQAVGEMYHRDEVEGEDRALGQPGRVITGPEDSPLVCDYRIEGNRIAEGLITQFSNWGTDEVRYVSSLGDEHRVVHISNQGSQARVTGFVASRSSDEKYQFSFTERIPTHLREH